jgi:uncharacterized repeat protein (TIGR01451 family)
VTGSTTSTNIAIPTGTTPFQSKNNGGGDAFVAKIGATPASGAFPLSYFSYLGGSGADAGLAIAVDANQAAHITGSTTSPTGLDINKPVQSSLQGGTDAFAALLQTAASGQTGGYATYLGGSATDDATGIAVDSNANTYVAGETNSPTFPVTNGSVLNGSGSDAFVTKLGVTSSLTTSVTSSSASSSNIIGVGNQVTFTYTITNVSTSTTDVASNVVFNEALPPNTTADSITSTPGSCTGIVNNTSTCLIGTLGVGAKATVKVSLTPTAVGTLSNNATVAANGTAAVAAAPASVTVTDFKIAVSPGTNTVAAGNSATYQVTASPAVSNQAYPNSISFSCSAGLPSGTNCALSTNPITMSGTSPASSTLTISTTARPVTSPAAVLQHRHLWYAVVPTFGVALLGFGLGSCSRKRRLLLGFFVLAMLSFSLFMAGCGGSNTSQTPPAGTPAGTYAVTVTATSGKASHATTLTLVVQ